MPFEQIINEDNAKGANPSFENGAKIEWRRIKTKGGVAQFVKITLGKNAASALSFVSDKHKCRVMFGTGDDAGQIAVQVDNTNGDFPANKTKSKQVTIVLREKTARLRFKPDFQTVYLEKIDLVPMRDSNRYGILHLKDHSDIFVGKDV